MSNLFNIASFLYLEPKEEFKTIQINCALSIDDNNFDGESIGWCSDANIFKLKNLSGGNVMISKKGEEKIDFPVNHLKLLVLEVPRRSFAAILREFFEEKQQFGSIDSSATIHESVQYEKSEVEIGANVVIEKGCCIGKRAVIGHNTVLKIGTHVGDDVIIGSNCTIGGVGFGYEMTEEGMYERIPHIGNVEIGNAAEIGNNVCIDRAVMGSTKLAANVKVDNLVHIAHGVEVGENSLIIAHAMIAGSVKIGKNVWVAPSSAIRQKLTIEDNALIGLGSVVVKDVQVSQTVAGVPARPIPKK